MTSSRGSSALSALKPQELTMELMTVTSLFPDMAGNIPFLKRDWFAGPLGLWWASWVAQMVKRLSTMWETRVLSLGWEDPLEKEMATHSSTLAWKIPRTEEPGRLQSMGSLQVGHDWATSLSLWGAGEYGWHEFTPLLFPWWPRLHIVPWAFQSDISKATTLLMDSEPDSWKRCAPPLQILNLVPSELICDTVWWCGGITGSRAQACLLMLPFLPGHLGKWKDLSEFLRAHL